MRNKKLFEEWQETAYFDWLEKEREYSVSAIKSLAEDIGCRSPITKYAMKRISELLKEIEEIDAELYPEEAE